MNFSKSGFHVDGLGLNFTGSIKALISEFFSLTIFYVSSFSNASILLSSYFVSLKPGVSTRKKSSNSYLEINCVSDLALLLVLKISSLAKKFRVELFPAPVEPITTRVFFL